MKPRYKFLFIKQDDRYLPAVEDSRRPGADKVICFSCSITASRKIATALNQHEQRRLELKVGA